MPDDDVELIQRARSGDTAAIAEIYDRYQSALFRYVLAQVGDVHVAEEIAGEVFLRLVERVDRLVYKGRPLLAWLFTVARNLVKDHYRQYQGVLEVPLEGCLIAGKTDTQETVECRMNQEQLAAALAQITDEQRQVVLLRFIEGFDLKSVARILGKPVGAVKSLQSRGLAALQRILGEKGAG